MENNASDRVERGAKWMMKPLCGSLLLLLSGCGQVSGAVSSDVSAENGWGGAVLTGRNDNYRSGANPFETRLKPSNVNANSFGLLYSVSLDGNVYTQPLFVPDVRTSNRTSHDLVFVATTHNSVYALDADTGATVWMTNLGPAVPTAGLNGTLAGQVFSGIVPEIGIVGTPAIDRESQVLWVVANNLEPDGSDMHRLHALRLEDGSEWGDPVEVNATAPGNGTSSVNGVQTLIHTRQVQRTGLLLDHGKVYVAFGANGDFLPWNGWIVAFSASPDKRQMATFITAPDGEASGIWQGGNGLSADDRGDIYFSVGNGNYTGNPGYAPGRAQVGLGSSVSRIRFRGDRFDLVDWFIPFDVQTLNNVDADLGSGAILDPERGLIYAFNKGGGVSPPGEMYAVHMDNFGHFQATQAAQVTQTIIASDPDHTADPTQTLRHKIHGPPVRWRASDGERVYLWDEDDFLRAYSTTPNGLNPVSVAAGNVIAVSAPGTGMLAVSSFYGENGIVWGNIKITEGGVDKGVLYAFDANTLTKLWSSRDNQTRDEEGAWPKFVTPVPAGGKVFMATTSQKMNVYGLLK